MRDTSLYIVSGLLMILTFAISRVAVFPYLYWKYAVHASIVFWEVPFNIPIKCNMGCLIIFVLQMYWLVIMIRGAFRAFYNMYNRSVSNKWALD
jgi:hypothetical protein